MSILRVILGNTQRELFFDGTPLLSDMLVSAGFTMAHPCGGKGQCQKCLVRFVGKAEMQLSCQTTLHTDCTIILPNSSPMQIETSEKIDISHLNPLRHGRGAVLDIGTTTLALNVYDLQSGALLGKATMINPQTAIAADVMGRIRHAMDNGLDTLNAQLWTALESLVHMASVTDIATIVVTGNTSMLYFFTKRNPLSLSHAPFQADWLFDEWITRPHCHYYLPACMNAFVGADITCAVLASGIVEHNETALLCDIGTNGELALWKDGMLYVTSTAAGPAFEGASISCGCASITGAIDRVSVANGQLHTQTIGDVPAIGICGSGLIDAVAALVELDIVDETGAMDEAMPLDKHVSLQPKDIRQVQLAKAAIAAGIQTLLDSAQISCEAVSCLYIAGGFGHHINIQSAIAIGLLPHALKDKVKVLGNASLTGAAYILLNKANLETSRYIAQKAVHVDLGGNAVFNEHYMNQMMFIAW